MRELPLVPSPVASSGEDAAHAPLAAREGQVALALARESAPGEARRRFLPRISWRRDLAPGRAGLLLLAALALALVAIAYRTTFAWMGERWSDAHDYYGHGPLVPLVSAFLAWRVRDRLALRPDARSAALGLGVVFLALAVHVVSTATLGVHFVSGATLLAVLAGSAVATGGLAFARALAFPLGFLAFALPLPEYAISLMGLELKHVAASAAVRGLDLLRVTAIREGSVVHLASGDVTVEDACSGLRSLVALLAMGVLVAGLDRGVAAWRRAAIVALAFPVALLANAVRVAFLCLAASVRGPGVLDTWIHEGSGIGVFALSLAALLLAKRALCGAPSPVVREERKPGETAGAAVFLPLVLLTLLLSPAAAATIFLERAPRSSAPPVALGLPLDTGTWKGAELPIEPIVRKVLDTNDLISRRYTKPGRGEVGLYVAASRGDRKVAHPPEICLRGGGFKIEERSGLELAREVRATRLLLVRGRDRQLIVYFYAAGTTLGPDYLLLQLRSALARLGDPDVPSALVRFDARLSPGEDEQAALDSIRDLAGEVLPALRERLSEGSP